MYANALLWVEQFIPVKSHITSILSGTGGIGLFLAPVVVGNDLTIYAIISAE